MKQLAGRSCALNLADSVLALMAWMKTGNKSLCITVAIGSIVDIDLLQKIVAAPQAANSSAETVKKNRSDVRPEVIVMSPPMPG
jgi:hypothetical protein